MNRRIASSPWPFAALAIAVLAAPAAAQSYGPSDQVLTIGFGDLRASDDYAPPFASDGYGYPGAGQFLAPLQLPEGAELRQLCFYVNDHNPSASAQASIVAVKLVPGGGGFPQIATIPNSLVASTSDVGYGYYCTGPIGYTLRSQVDVDGDGTSDAAVYYVKVVGDGDEDPVGIGTVWLIWGRQVSPAPASPTFSDVPASDGAYAYVEALAASGITSGCGGGRYCPDATLTRRQMAIFLAKALGLHWND
jgi:hypothetical protein